LRELATRLRDLHAGPDPLILANAWDVSSALAVGRAGAAAIATSSGAVAAARGYPDGEVMPVEEMLEAVGRIAVATSLPVTADMETGYGLSGPDLVAGLLEAGAIGLNLEDTDRSGGTADHLLATDAAAARIAEVRAAADAAGVPLVINARVDTFLRGSGTLDERVDAAIKRGRAYLAAGADCIYPIFLADAAAIRRLCDALDAPVNILLRPGAPSIGELAGLGVRRISVGSGLSNLVDAEIERVTRQLLAGDGSAFAV
jgi:2-methylisocitrate lyase-like PEP mutase family enzyme